MSATDPPIRRIAKTVASWVSAFTAFDEAHGFAVNLFVVVALAAIGATFLTGQRRLVRPAVIAFTVLCLADWVLIEDFGFFGGLGTDPNSMIPMALVVVAGYLALTRVPVPAADPVAVAPAGAPTATATAATATAATATAPGEPEPASPGLSRRDRLRPARLARAFGAAGTRAVLATWAVAIIILGTAPMALAQASRTADPLIAQAIDGNAAPLDLPAPAFTLTDQHGQPASLTALRGKVVLLTFLDPVCTSDCPLIAQEFRQADQMLGPAARDVELVAIVANPLYHSVGYTQAFDRQENLTALPNWLFLTGSVPQLQQAWKDYSVTAQILPAGGMTAHSDVAFVIDRAGHTRTELDFDPGPGTATTVSSFAAELTSAARQAGRPS